MSVEGSREVAYRLIERSDIFISNLTPRMFERWGLTYEDLCRVKPDIIAAYQPMLGLWGPHRDHAGFGAVLTPITGISHLSGDPDRKPVGVGTNFPDYAINPGHTVVAILAALRHRRRTGQGQRIELAQVESVSATMGPALLDYTANCVNQIRKGNRSSWMCPHGIYRCADDPSGRERWIAIAVGNDAQWESFCAVAEAASFASDDRFATLLGRRRHEDQLDSMMSDWTASCDAASLAGQLQSVESRLRWSTTARTCASTTNTWPSAASTSISTIPRPTFRSTTVQRSSCTGRGVPGLAGAAVRRAHL